MFKKILLLVVISFFVTGCAKKQLLKPIDKVVPVETQKSDTDEPSIRFNDWASTPELKTIHFDYDKAEVTPDAAAILKKNAEYLKKNPAFDIIVEGNTDERGTVEYNLGLGQKRAAVVREYYSRLGVNAGKIGTISYGEEKPLDPGTSELAWLANRRAETKVRNRKSVDGAIK